MLIKVSMKDFMLPIQSGITGHLNRRKIIIEFISYVMQDGTRAFIKENFLGFRISLSFLNWKTGRTLILQR